MKAPAQQRSLDNTQYAYEQIRKYEAMYGRNFISPGGYDTAIEFIRMLRLSRGEAVLDVGCGLGGSAFLMAVEFGAHVHGIDVSRNMIEIARQRCKEEGVEELVTLEQADCLDIKTSSTYDAIYSRDVFLHLHRKKDLFCVLERALVAGGQLLFTDYSWSAVPKTAEFHNYVKQRNYCLHTLTEYRALLENAGFVEITIEDRTDQFIEIHKRELTQMPKRLLTTCEAVELSEGWRAKIQRATRGEQRWGLFTARKSD